MLAHPPIFTPATPLSPLGELSVLGSWLNVGQLLVVAAPISHSVSRVQPALLSEKSSDKNVIGPTGGIQTAFGGVVSSTRTCVFWLKTLPDTSVIVTETVWAPNWEQSNEVGLILTVGLGSQLSDILLTTSAGVIVTFPVLSNCTVGVNKVPVGGVLSSIVTLVKQTSLFPAASKTSNWILIGLSAISAQV